MENQVQRGRMIVRYKSDVRVSPELTDFWSPLKKYYTMNNSKLETKINIYKE